MSERKAKGCLIAALVWCMILAILGVGYRFLVHPYLREKLQQDTSSSSQYQEEWVVAADSFSGYAVLRSPILRQLLRDQQIKLTVQDDQADYAGRLKALRDGKVQLAAFTIDSLLTTGSELGEFPGTIVMVIDETYGGDAIVAKKTAVSSLQDLNDPEARLVLTPRSPSEFLARVVIAHFNLPRLSENWMVPADGARRVYEQLRGASADAKRAYVLWEPYVSKALELPDVHVLLNTSRLQGYVVDVLVAQRAFLRDHPEKVQQFLEAYSRAAYTHGREPDGMVRLVQEDAQQTGTEQLDTSTARQIVDGIRWRNTLENYVHFGLANGSGLAHLEDMLGNIVDVLVKTRALPADPLNGQYHTLFYQQSLAEMKSAGFHPGKGLNLIPGLGATAEGDQPLQTAGSVQTLTEDQWQQLQSVGELKVEPIVFVRGSSRISIESRRDLVALAKRLQTFPQFYVRIMGHTRAEGDAEANRQLAQDRARAAAEVLVQEGIASERTHIEASPSTAESGAGQAVAFVVGQLPY